MYKQCANIDTDELASKSLLPRNPICGCETPYNVPLRSFCDAKSLVTRQSSTRFPLSGTRTVLWKLRLASIWASRPVVLLCVRVRGEAVDTLM
ncbi:hypothetical protein LX36DRAFT_110561 [Colletotrichum falcatum]|nr:hypothetical protein LX36DRAFT_110561 [Colletotrichum falcatum]